MEMLPFACLALMLAAQDTTFRATVPLVVVPTTVTDHAGRYIDGLNPRDFVLTVDGRFQPAHMDTFYQPISLVVAIQTNQYAEAALAKVRKIGGMIEPLVTGAGGECAVLGFSDQVRTLQPFTPDGLAIRAAFARARPDGAAAHMFDAVSEAVQLLSTRGPRRRRVLLLISETKDRSSRAHLDQVLSSAQRHNVAVYAATYSAYATPFTARPEDYHTTSGLDLLALFREVGRLGKEDSSEALVRYTGGRRLSFLKQSRLEIVVAAIGEELHSQYTLSFTPASPIDHAYHEIQVRIVSRPDARVRTRPGYWHSDTP
jgi:VWFA-related protein